MKRPRVLLADDHSLLIAGIRRILQEHVELVGIAKDGREFVKAARELRPDVALVDIGMPLLNGIDAARQISKEAPEIKIIFLTMHTEPDYVIEAIKTGVPGFLLKSSAEEELICAIRTVMAGGRYITPLIPGSLLESILPKLQEKPPAGELSFRQREVLQLIAEGRTAKEIADILHVSTKTAEYHRYQIMRKLDLHSTAELTKYAMQKGLITLG
jgi:DNA-binding NarL/FixJ family response regulator